MDTSISCQICNSVNDILLGVCTSCGEDLPGYDKKIKILLLRLRHYTGPAAGAASSDDGATAALVAQLETKAAAAMRRVDELQAELDSKNAELLTIKVKAHTLVARDSSGDLDAERERLRAERKEIDALRRLVASLQTIPYIDGSQFKYQGMVGTSSTFDIQVGVFDNKRTVCKKLANGVHTEGAIEHFKSAIALMAKLDGAGGSVVSLYGASGLAQATPVAYMEYMEKGDLRKVLSSTSTTAMSWKSRLEIGANIARAIAKMHSLDLIHRDLNSHHVLLNERNVAKLTGFSSAREKSEDQMTNGIGLYRWAAPETMDGTGFYSEKVDIYSLGLLLIELDTHQMPYSSCKDKSGRPMRDYMLMDILRKAKPGVAHITHTFVSAPEWYRALALRCVDVDPTVRPSAVEVLGELTTQLREGAYDNLKSARRLRTPPAVINLRLTVMRAKNLLDTQAFGVQDPFCRISLGGKTAKTKVHDNGGCDPKWHETYAFANVHPLDMILEINILNKNWLISGQIGKVTVPLEETLERIDGSGSVVSWVPVFSRGEARGHLLLKFEYEGNVAQWLESVAEEMRAFSGAEGRVRDLSGQEKQMTKINEVLVPRLRELASGLGRVASMAA
ncbi:protein kinase [Achlya hypogyna]|uniref:Protein kinase n=1 Tax=Achlya hypogyna TaxID=1202772 RepID=A0A1V9ZA27_ACHHY|nr:protein kinase [Achlya hypogyna]